MPFTTCPSCDASLKYRASDTSVYCESCDTEVDVPISPKRPTTRPLRSTRRREQESGASQLIASPGDWRTCRIGLRIACGGATVIVVSWMLLAIVMLVVTPSMTPVQRADLTPTLRIVNVVAVGLIIVGVAVHVVGQIVCCFAPAGRRALAIGGLISFGSTLAATVLFFALASRLAGGGMSIAGVLVVVPLMIVAFGCWMRFVKGIAKDFAAKSVAIQCDGYLVFQVLLILAVLLKSMVMGPSRTINSNDPAITDVVFGLIQIGLTLWYLLLLGSIASALSRAIDQQGYDEGHR